MVVVVVDSEVEVVVVESEVVVVVDSEVEVVVVESEVVVVVDSDVEVVVESEVVVDVVTVTGAHDGAGSLYTPDAACPPEIITITAPLP